MKWVMVEKVVSAEDVDRNLKLVAEGKALDMPLRFLDGVLKRKGYFQSDKYRAYQKAYKRAYQQSDKYKAYQQSDKYKANHRICNKVYYQKNKERILAKQSGRKE